jgi:hypothetical protein
MAPLSPGTRQALRPATPGNPRGRRYDEGGSLCHFQTRTGLLGLPSEGQGGILAAAFFLEMISVKSARRSKRTSARNRAKDWRESWLRWRQRRYEYT